jgi:2-polyprenyl-3-methyl-5-hydroxy-6-metoxy-1,4-benzoquinol methylase
VPGVSAHVYHREFNPDARDSLALIARRVAPGSRVLDLGAGPGVLGRHLHERLNCVLDGVEIDARAAALAKPFYQRLLCADLDGACLADLGIHGPYDYVICADIIEHLRQPAQLLDQVAAVLAPAGRLLVSVPNVAYAGLVADLMAGCFEYRDEGLLDRTHLRFFTRATLLSLLTGSGFRPRVLEHVVLPLSASEFSARRVDALAPSLRDWLLYRPDALTYQFVLESTLPAQGDGADLPLEDTIGMSGAAEQPEMLFRVQLFWRAADEGYAEQRSTVVMAALGAMHQELRFALPPGASIAALRLDPADRPGFIRLHAMSVLDAGGQLRWQWRAGDPPPACEWQQLRAVEPLQGEERALILHADGNDPALSFSLGGERAAVLTDGGMFVVEMSWPMSSDSRALARDYVPRQTFDALLARCEALEQRVARDDVPTAPGVGLSWWRRILGRGRHGH